MRMARKIEKKFETHHYYNKHDDIPAIRNIWLDLYQIAEQTHSSQFTKQSKIGSWKKNGGKKGIPFVLMMMMMM